MENEGTSLDDILNGSEPEPVAAPEPAPEPQQPRDEHGRFAPKGEHEPEAVAPPAPEGASPAPEMKPEPTLEHPALLGERRRRQEAENRARELEQQIAQFQQRQVQPTPEQGPPDIFEDPEGYTRWIREEAKREALSGVQQTVQQTGYQARLEVSEMLARDKYQDFDEKLQVFADLVNQNPALAVELQKQINPAEYAYRTAANYSQVSQLGSLDMDALKQQLREELKAEMLADTQSKLQTIPPTLAAERNVGNRGAGPSWSGPTSINDILRG